MLEFLIFTLIVLLVGFLIFPVPVRDGGLLRYRSSPWMTYSLIAANSAIFLLWILPDYYDYFGVYINGDWRFFPRYGDYYRNIGVYGFRAEYLRSDMGFGALTTFTSMFMHADFGHLIGNMAFLAAFGRRVEDACGPWRFLMYYLVAGVVAALGYGLLIPDEGAPGIGASGAIFGVMGAYFVLFRNRRIQCVWLFVVAVKFVLTIIAAFFNRARSRMEWTIELPALMVIFIYAGINLGLTIQAIDARQLGGGVNTVAHMSGFFAGALIVFFVRKDLLVRLLDRRPI